VQADWALFGGHVETMEAPREASAVAIAGGRFVAVGSEDEVRAACGDGTRVSDLEGRTILPGFIETHMHLEKIAHEMAMVQLEGVRSLGALLEALASAALRAPAQEWVRSFGDDGAWHERQLTERRLPTRLELDGVSEEHPVFLYRGPDAAVLNSRAAAVLAPRLETLEDVTWEAPSGLLRGHGARALEAELPSDAPARRLERLAEASVALLRMGVTTIVDPGLPGAFASSWDLYAGAQASGGLRQRVYLMNRFDPRRRFDDELARINGEAHLPGAGDERLRAWSVKLILDGEFDNAWMRPGERSSGKATKRYTPEEILRIVELCAERGWPLCIHAMGGGAIACVINAVADAVGRGATLRAAQISIAHAFLVSPADIRACAEFGIALSVHPMLAYVFAPEMQAAWGELAEAANPLATMLRSGVLVAGGSDTLPCEPLRGARYAVERRSRHGHLLGAGEAIDARAAIRMFTQSAGRYVEREDLGVIRPGCVADFVIWEENPLSTPPDRWLEIPVSLVSIGGSTAWKA
jgi:hypothetical protein